MSKLLIILSLLPNLIGLNFQSNYSSGRIKNLMSAKTSQVAAYTNEFPEISKLPLRRIDSIKPIIYANNYLLIDSNSNEILISKMPNQEVPIASTTKIMTAIIVLENYRLSDIVTVSAKAASQIGSEVELRVGEQISVENLLNCLLIKSGNDSAYALAEYYVGGVDGFVALMNNKAEQLKMLNTKYLDPAGLNPQGRSSAYDLSIITKYALKNPEFAKIVKTPEITITNQSGTITHQLKNSNRLVNDFNYFGALGVKTGYLPEAGHCLVGAAERKGVRLIAVVLNTNADTPTASAVEARKLLDYGFDSFVF